nr:HGGxSTG domain-containing protein [uncultured Glaciecola sp.]
MTVQVWGNGRCKYHGGASTGPVTSEGKKRVSMNSRQQSPCGH